jgi:hypothetical protein
MIEWSWRIEGKRRIWCGRWGDGERWPRAFGGIERAKVTDHAMAPDYWEVGASGRRYSRNFILRFLDQNPPIDAFSADWQSCDFGLRRLGQDTYLLTYTLHQGDRVTRRATIWRETAGGWCILYHQGTIVSSEGHGVVPRATGSERVSTRKVTSLVSFPVQRVTDRATYL